MFVNIKVDREERPDIDQIYQTAHQMLTQRAGGWPLTMFLTPDQKPFFGGTYFPKTRATTCPASATCCERVAQIYREQGEAIAAQNEELVSMLGQTVAAELRRRPQPRPGADRRRAASSCKASSIRLHGGLGGAPKFPHPASSSCACAKGRCAATPRRSEVASFTLEKMAQGGIYDQLGGGFCRYSVDQLLDDPALREDALRQRPAAAAVCGRMAGHRRGAVLRGSARRPPAG